MVQQTFNLKSRAQSLVNERKKKLPINIGGIIYWIEKEEWESEQEFRKGRENNFQKKMVEFFLELSKKNL